MASPLLAGRIPGDELNQAGKTAAIVHRDGLEASYQSCGYPEAGRCAEALRLHNGDRKKVLMAPWQLRRTVNPVPQLRRW